MSGGVYRLNGYNSVRRLNTRREVSAGGFVPTDITGCVLWLDFSDADTLFVDAGITKVSADGDLIYQANDKSGNNYHAVKASDGYSPIYKTNILNSLSAGYAAISERYYMTHSYPLGTATDFTTFVAFRYMEFASLYPSVFGYAWGAPTFHTSLDGTSYAGTDSPNRIVTEPGYVATNTNYLLELKKSGTSSGNLRLYKNAGVPLVNIDKTAANPTPTKMAVFNAHLTRAHAMCGYIYEYLIYNTALSDTDRQSVETYLNNKWAIY